MMLSNFNRYREFDDYDAMNMSAKSDDIDKPDLMLSKSGRDLGDVEILTELE